MHKRLAILVTALLGGCTTAVVPSVTTAPPPPTYPSIGLERVVGQTAAGLTQFLGQPDADVREGSARKLQFAGQFCVLDAYLYPKGSDEPRVTYLDAREPDGSPIDRASCVAALTRREGGK